MNNRGVALIAVLWVVTILSGVVAGGFAGARLGVRTSQNRIVLARARWAAEACAAIVEGRWANGNSADSGAVDLGSTVHCSWTIHDPTSRLNVNTAPLDYLGRMLQNLRIPSDSAQEFLRVLAVLRQARRIHDPLSLADLPGFDSRVLPHITTDGAGTVNVVRATPEVLQALPGITPEAANLLLRARSQPRAITSLEELVERLSEPSRAALEQHGRELSRVVRFRSEQLLMRATGWAEAFGASPRAEVELLFVPLPNRFAMIRRRLS